jgi:hypothetical protein
MQLSVQEERMIVMLREWNELASYRLRIERAFGEWKIQLLDLTRPGDAIVRGVGSTFEMAWETLAAPEQARRLNEERPCIACCDEPSAHDGSRAPGPTPAQGRAKAEQLRRALRRF